MQSPNAAANGTGPRAPAASRYMAWTMGLALVLATGFVTFAPSTLSPEVLRASLARLVRPTSAPGAAGAGLSLNRRIGLVAGHFGNDSGAVCADGLTEAAVNKDIADRVVTILRGQTLDELEHVFAKVFARTPRFDESTFDELLAEIEKWSLG